jgi:hypothetical protein
MSKMASHEPFGHPQPKLWAKEWPGVKLAIWLPTTKSRESTSSRRLQQECDMALEISWRELQLWFKPRPHPSSGREVMNAQSPGSPNRDSFGIHFGSPGKKSHLDVAFARSCREGGGFPRVWAVMSQVSPSRRWLVPTPERVQNEF